MITKFMKQKNFEELLDSVKEAGNILNGKEKPSRIFNYDKMILPTIYKTTATGAIQEWTIHVEGNTYYTVSGQKGGKLVVSKPTICSGKNIGKANETSDMQQALAEATAKRDKKLKTDYVASLDLLGSNETSYVEPMLAKKFIDRRDKIKYDVGVQIKFNGLRCIATKNGLHTRKGEKYISVPHIEESLKEFFQLFPDAVLDGELYNYDLRKNLNEIVKLCRKTKLETITKEDFDRSRELVKYYVYDGYGIGSITKENFYLERKNIIHSALKYNPYYCQVQTHIAKSEEEVYKLYQSFVDDGQEGAIVRILDSPYENKRSSYLLKVKPTDDDEFKIIDIEEGKGNRSGMAGRVILEMNDNSNRTFASNLKGNEQQFIDVLKNKDKYIGKMVTIYYNGFTGLGIPNYAQFDCNNSIKGDR